MPTDLPDQKTEAILADLVTALDRGDDDRRTALLLRWHWLSLDQERDADLARLRETGIGPVTVL